VGITLDNRLDAIELARVEKHDKQKDSLEVIESLAAISYSKLDMSIAQIINQSIQFANSNLGDKVFIPEFSNVEFSDLLMNWWIETDPDKEEEDDSTE